MANYILKARTSTIYVIELGRKVVGSVRKDADGTWFATLSEKNIRVAGFGSSASAFRAVTTTANVFTTNKEYGLAIMGLLRGTGNPQEELRAYNDKILEIANAVNAKCANTYSVRNRKVKL